MTCGDADEPSVAAGVASSGKIEILLARVFLNYKAGAGLQTKKLRGGVY
jgi:hypothetical protein